MDNIKHWAATWTSGSLLYTWYTAVCGSYYAHKLPMSGLMSAAKLTLAKKQYCCAQCLQIWVYMHTHEPCSSFPGGYNEYALCRNGAGGKGCLIWCHVRNGNVHVYIEMYYRVVDEQSDCSVWRVLRGM